MKVRGLKAADFSFYARGMFFAHFMCSIFAKPAFIGQIILETMRKYLLHSIFCLLAFSCMTACGKNNPEEIDDGPDKPFEPIALTKAEAEISSASNNFGFEVYHRLYDDDQMMVSPLSLSLALALAASGSAGQTAKEMCSTLGFSDFTTEEVSAYYQKMVTALLEADPKTTFEVANSIWANPKVNVKKGFIENALKYYSSEVYDADFAKQSTVDAVNKWCSDKTHGKINSIMDEPNPYLMMALINALYFYGKWSFEFEDAKKENFVSISGNTIKVEMMHSRDDLLYSEYDGYSMVTLPYGNGSFAMDVILPDEKVKFSDAVAGLNAETLMILDRSASTCEVDLKLPKFTFEYTADMTKLLTEMGMSLAFSDYADFSEMAEKSLKISQVKQKTFIDVNEKGTEAAAVTFIGMMATSVGPAPQKRFVEFHADRPFVFVIREKSTGAILFIGQKVS